MVGGRLAVILDTDLDEINAPDSLLRRLEKTPNPELYYQYGEDPARFLGRDLDRDDGIDLTLGRIRGLDDLDLLAEYLRIEAAVFKRKRVVAALNRRKLELESLPAPEGREPREIVVEDESDDEPEEPIVYRHVAEDCLSEDVERISPVALECHGCGRRVPNNRVEEVKP
jgi:hypothetical protein